jgi:hypothetical protein
MTKSMIKIHDIATGEVFEREPNAAELAQQGADQAAEAARQEAEAAKVADKAALLAKLGITVEEAKLLLS